MFGLDTDHEDEMRSIISCYILDDEVCENLVLVCLDDEKVSSAIQGHSVTALRWQIYNIVQTYLMTSPESDRLLLMLLQSGDSEKIEFAMMVLFDKYQSYLINFAASRFYTLPIEEIEDAVASSWQIFIHKVPEFEWRGSPIGSYLAEIVKNTLYGRYRKFKNRAETNDLTKSLDVLELYYSDDDVGMLRQLLRKQQMKLVYSALETLKLKQRQVITLVCFLGYSHQDCAVLLGTDAQNVRQIKRRAIKVMKEQIEKILNLSNLGEDDDWMFD